MSLNKSKIEWTDYTWNPIVGCKHGCPYCYAKKLNDRFKFIKNWNEPEIFLDRLNQKMPKEPSKIFVGSMSDVFGEWVSLEWIERIIAVVRKNPQHTFQFLTKNPKRYSEFQFPKNCWLGTTVEHFENRERITELRKNSGYKFVSIEPILGSFHGVDFLIDLVIVGAMTGAGATPPEKDWIESLQNNKTIKKIFWKNNILKFIK